MSRLCIIVELLINFDHTIFLYSQYIYIEIYLQDCAICCEKMNEPSGYAHGVSSENALDGSVVYQLKKCKHFFHKMCIVAMYNSGTKVS